MIEDVPIRSFPPPDDFVLGPGQTLMLRTCDEHMRAYNEFQWPMRGEVAAPDWSPVIRCGQGLHGFLRGVGAGSLASWEPTAIWLVVEITEATAVQLDGKIKVPRGVVRYAGERGEALALMSKHGQLDPGHLCEQQSATGDRGTASATGDRGTASATGDRGTASATGKHAIALASTVAEVGELGTLIIKYWDTKAERWRVRVGYAGEDGIEAGGRYQLDEHGKFIRVQAED